MFFRTLDGISAFCTLTCIETGAFNGGGVTLGRHSPPGEGAEPGCGSQPAQPVTQGLLTHMVSQLMAPGLAGPAASLLSNSQPHFPSLLPHF